MKSSNQSREESSYTVTVGLLSQIIRYLSSKNVDTDQFLQDIEIDHSILLNPDARFAVEKYILFEEKAAEIIGDPCFGLHMGQFTEPGNWTILGYMMMNCSNVLEAFQKLNRYSDIIGNLIKGEIVIKNDEIIVKLTEPKDAPRISEHCYDGFFSSLINLARNLTGQTICPVEVSLTCLKNEYIEEYKRIFGEKVIFNSDQNYMIFERSVVETPTLLPNQNLLECFENYAKEFLKEIDAYDSYTYRTKKLILSFMDSEILSIRTIAKELNISERALQVNLHKEGTEFSTLLRDTRIQLAKKYLQGTYSIEEITYLLGFSEASVFRKAFKKWVGITPGEYRDERNSEG